ncbi:hypothetical protein GCM10009677_31340 [Sphaerisporangium rubeum]|uniref:MFS transporter n=1 Tax=Sphaerisporangium rubeum TaxID=321317 RepID=A0A7X0IDF1_9ACTN|nr:hypothetical protein [Sphaerisporangium rubeum]MBB6472434.1 hypothetical protein [Sphaerisporangium rubeum]
MAVPPAPSVPAARLAGFARVNRLPFAADVVVGLLAVIGLPLAIVAIPNTISVVSALLPPGLAGVGILRAHGLALPVMLCVVPLAGAALRRFRPAPLVLAGLAMLAAADLAGGFAGSAFEVGALRAMHGAGAGLLVPATFAAAWERPRAARRVLVPLWAAALCASLLAAQALALWPLADVTSWRVTLQPYPLLTGVALAVAAVHLAVSRRGEAGSSAAIRWPAAGRRALVLTAGPSAGVAALAVGTTFNWPSELILVAAAVAVVSLPAMACVRQAGGSEERMAALVMIAVGLVVLPTAAQVTYVELGGLGGPGLSGLWAAFALAALAAFAAAFAAVRFITARSRVAVTSTGAVDPSAKFPGPAALEGAAAARSSASGPSHRDVGDDPVPLDGTASGLGADGGAQSRAVDGPVARLVAAGLVAVVAGLCGIRLLVPSATGLPLVVPLVLLAAGAAVAVSAAVLLAGPHAGLFGLSLCFPAVLSGFLLGTGIQVGWLRAISASGTVTSQAMVDGFVGALHVWALVAGFVVVAILVLGALLRRRDPAPRPAPPSPDPIPSSTAGAHIARAGDTVAFPAVPPGSSPAGGEDPHADPRGHEDGVGGGGR